MTPPNNDDDGKVLVASFAIVVFLSVAAVIGMSGAEAGRPDMAQLIPPLVVDKPLEPVQGEPAPLFTTTTVAPRPPATTTTTTEAVPPATVATTQPPAPPPPGAGGEGSIPDIVYERFAARFGHATGERAVAVVECETAGTFDPRSTGDEGERGLLQIHPKYHQERIARLGFTWDDMYEVEPNLAVGMDLFAEQGWGPWSCA